MCTDRDVKQVHKQAVDPLAEDAAPRCYQIIAIVYNVAIINSTAPPTLIYDSNRLDEVTCIEAKRRQDLSSEKKYPCRRVYICGDL